MTGGYAYVAAGQCGLIILQFTPACFIEIISPKGVESWCSGMEQDITWQSFLTSGNVEILYSSDNGSNWQTVVDNTPDDGIHPWLLPGEPSTNCLVKVCDKADSTCYDVSDSSFNICGATFADFIGIPQSDTGQTCEVQFTDQSSGCVTGWFWDFGDGSYSFGRDQSHAYACGDTYTVSVTVLWPCGSDITVTKQNYISCECPCQLSDCDGNGSVNILDALWEVNCVLGVHPPSCSCDCNQDGSDNILDVLCIVNIILGGHCP